METYYNPEDLLKFEDIGKDSQHLADKFFDYYNAVLAEGELTQREKSLIGLAVAHAVQCPYCIDSFTQSCLENGSNLYMKIGFEDSRIRGFKCFNFNAFHLNP